MSIFLCGFLLGRRAAGEVGRDLGERGLGPGSPEHFGGLAFLTLGSATYTVVVAVSRGAIIIQDCSFYTFFVHANLEWTRGLICQLDSSLFKKHSVLS